MQFGFMTGRITTNVIFILKQLQQKSLHEEKNTYFAFFDQGKIVDCVPCTVFWWAMWKLGIHEWIIQIVTSMYENDYSKVTITNGYNKPISASISVHQGSVLTPLLFIIVIKPLLREFRIGCPWELLYTSVLVLVAESLGELKMRLKNWKKGLKVKELKINVEKTKFMCSRYKNPSSGTRSQIAS